MKSLAVGWSVAALALTVVAAEPTMLVRLNTVGYLPDADKRASIAAPAERYFILRADDGRRVFSGRVTGPVHNDDTDEKLYVADFSRVREPGEYRLDVPGVGQSASFRIAPDLYDRAFYLVTRAMYLWRCGTAVRGELDGREFAHEACHLDDGWLDFVTGSRERKDGTGGWHDAGDYNKYVTNAGITVGVMLRAWEDFQPALESYSFDLPESGGPIPDFLAEIKWETDWLLKMQAEDGSVFHKLSTRAFGGFIPPEEEKDDRYFVPWSTTATANLVAILASTARAVRPYDDHYADQCLAAAEKSYAFLAAHPGDHQADQTGFSTGRYARPDRQARLWAAAEMWETTGAEPALEDFESRLHAMDVQVDETFDWGNERNLALLTYYFSARDGRDPTLVARIRDSLVATADAVVAKSRSHGYARPLGSLYYWGGNGAVARQTLILQAADRIAPESGYRTTALNALNHLFGRNVHGRSYVMGIGFRPPMHPHDRRMSDGEGDNPWPGYLVGGPNPGAADWFDVRADYRTNETAINWNGALIYALAGFVTTRAP